MEWAVYHPNVPELLISSKGLCDSNHTILFEKPHSHIRLSDGTVVPITWNNLPIVKVNFRDDCTALTFDIEDFESDVDNFDLDCFVAKTDDALLKHRRCGHLHIPGLVVNHCPECLESKGTRVSSDDSRADQFKPSRGCEQLDADFWGPVPHTSVRGKQWVLVFICPVISYVFIFPVATREECADCLKLVVSELDRKGIKVCRVRSDNAPEFRGANSRWVHMTIELKVERNYSIPYTPSMNGVVERWNRTMGTNLTAMLIGVDKSLWCYASQYLGHLWNIIPKRKLKSSPLEKLRKLSKDKRPVHGLLNRARRFGCLVYFKHHEHQKLTPNCRKAVFLGVSEANSGYLCGYWQSDNRCKDGIRFATYETRDITWCEDRLVSNLDELKSSIVTQSSNCDGSRSAARSPDRLDSGSVRPSASAPVDSDSYGIPKSVVPDVLPVVDNSNIKPSIERDVDWANSLLTNNDNPDLAGNPDFVRMDEGVEVYRKRGRPKGSKDKRQRTRRKKEKVATKESFEAAMLALGTDCVDSDEEILEEIIVLLTRTDVYSSPEAPQWLESENKENLTLLAAKCWRPITDDDLKDIREVVPSCVIFTRKRCGKFKARLVALGNRQQVEMAGEIYSPTISHVANRALLITAAAEGYHMSGFDLTAAFINATVAKDEHIFLRLPREWSSDKKKGDVVKLLKCLYGLKQSPRRWYDCYAQFLRERDWVECSLEPGLWFKDGMYLSVYVDDSIIAGPNRDRIWHEQEIILQKFKGNVLMPTYETIGNNVFEVRDVLGATHHHCRESRIMSISMEIYIDKVLKKFNLTNSKVVCSPFIRSDLEEGAEVNYPMKSLMGALQWIATICRPDIQFAVQRLQRVTKITTAAVSAAKRICQYLKGTKSLGIEYNRKQEVAFRESYGQLLDKAQPLANVTLFSDADFAGCCQTFKSTSGSIIFFRGTPLAWSSKRQSIRSHSTCEAEYIACHDAILLREQQGFLNWFTDVDSGSGDIPYNIFVDNASAVKVSKQSINTKRSKHFALRYLKVRDCSDHIFFVPTKQNLADPLTKALPRESYMSMMTGGSFYEKPKFVYDDSDIKVYYANSSYFD